MTHEPESHWPDSWSVLHMGSPEVLSQWAGDLPMQDYRAVRDYLDMVLRATYRNGYNDHARSVQHWQDTHGAYRTSDGGPFINDATVPFFNQHGQGENP